jgi:hypothetical protein
VTLAHLAEAIKAIGQSDRAPGDDSDAIVITENELAKLFESIPLDAAGALPAGSWDYASKPDDLMITITYVGERRKNDIDGAIAFIKKKYPNARDEAVEVKPLSKPAVLRSDG